MSSAPAGDGQSRLISLEEFFGIPNGQVNGSRAHADRVNGTVRHEVDVRPHRGWFQNRGRKIEGTPGDGSRLIAVALGLLFVLAGGLLGVSYAAQFVMIVAQRHGQILASNVEALSADVALMIFSLLALGLARKGLNAIVARWGVVCMAGLSAAMNYAAANGGDWRSVLTYCGPSVLLAFVVDTTVSVIKKHYLGMRSEASPFMQFARLAGKIFRFLALIALYVLRMLLAPIETPKGLRQMVLNATPLPQAPEPVVITVTQPKSARQVPPAKDRKAIGPPKGTRGPRANSKKARFLSLVERTHGPFGDIDESRAYEIAQELAPQFDFSVQQARNDLSAAIAAARLGGK